MLARLTQFDKAGQVAKPQAPQLKAEEPLSEDAKGLPEHIVKSTEARKLNAQTPFFRCPTWADLPSRAWHLDCTRDGATLPALGLHRYPFYIFGKSPVCDYVLEHPSVSSIHAVLVFHKQQECFVLVDLGSTNGSRVNRKLIERQKPIPVPAGTVLQFGYSTRVYTVRTGVPPCHREHHATTERDAQTSSSSASMTTTTTTTTTTTGGAAAPTADGKRPRERDDGKDSKGNSHGGNFALDRTSGPSLPPPTKTPHTECKATPTSNTAEANTAPTTTAAAHANAASNGEEQTTAMPGAVEAAAVAPEKVHLYHLVIKHKDVDNAVSRAERNKDEAITRSRQDALDIAHFVLSSHAEKDEEGNKKQEGTGKPIELDRWTVEEFIAAVEAYSELATNKKKKKVPGDLGVVERGTFSEEFDQAAFALRREEVSQPVETPLGIHLIYRCD